MPEDRRPFQSRAWLHRELFGLPPYGKWGYFPARNRIIGFRPPRIDPRRNTRFELGRMRRANPDAFYEGSRASH